MRIWIQVRYLARHSQVYSIYRGEEEAETEEEKQSEEKEGQREMSVLSGQRKPVLSERGEEEGGGCGAFTEEALSGWRSPPLPRLSAQTQTAPEEEEEVEEAQMQGEEEGKGSFSV